MFIDPAKAIPSHVARIDGRSHVVDPIEVTKNAQRLDARCVVRTYETSRGYP
jgi:hypothetical protein